MDIARHVSQRYRWALAVSVAAGAALLALRGISRPVVREIVREPVVEVAAPDIQVPVHVASGGESRLRRIAALLALFGVVLYVYLTIVYDHFYSVLHVEPADVGLSYGTTLSRSSGLILVVVAIAGAALFLLRWIRTWLGAVFATVFEVPPLAIFPLLPLVLGVVVLWATAPILTYPFTEPTREASVAATAVLAGRPVAPVRLGKLVTLIDLRAEAVTLMAARPGDSAVRHLTKRMDLLYLGQADGTVVLFDPAARQALHLPADTVLMRLSRPAPRQGRVAILYIYPAAKVVARSRLATSPALSCAWVLTSPELLSPNASVDHAIRYSIDSPSVTTLRLSERFASNAV